MEKPTGTTSLDRSLLRDGEACWRRAKANRVSFIVDAAQYFAAAKAAMLKAEKAVYLIGWEFDLGIRLRPDQKDAPVPDQLRQFLVHIASQRPDLEIFMLQWDGAMAFNIARQLASFLLLKAQTKPQIHFRLDSEHPTGACHHQKIVVIDDAIAFCGGIDMTTKRWDTPEHIPDDQRRSAHGSVPESWHDMTTAVDGDAAKSLGELARWRWKLATGSELPVPDGDNAIWPDALSVDCRDVEVAISRTLPAYKEELGTFEIERLWTDAIAAAGKSIYIENQYLSSGAIAEALKARLRERNGPEIVIILPSSAESWLESEVMDSARSLIISDLRAADREGRLGIYYPVNAADEPIYVHAKVLIVDDRFIRVGSSNMSNRSMRFDSECDLAIESANEATGAVIRDLRGKLLAEHLGIPVTAFAATLQQSGEGLIRAIETSRAADGKTLRILRLSELSPTEEALARSRLLDPEARVKLSGRLSDFLKRFARRQEVPLAVMATLLGALAFGRLRSRLPK